jgi:thiopurine S-methyltransferase
LKILVPLCGKTVDMKWLFDEGHRVVGAEASRLAIEDFFKEQSLQYTTETKNGIPVFVEKSGGIIIYCCDFYDFTKTGESSFDAIWDRGSLAAINPEDRIRYVALVTSLKTINSPHLIELYEYDDSFHNEFPYSVPMSKVLKLFGERYDVKLIESHEAKDVMTSVGIKVIRNLFLTTLK